MVVGKHHTCSFGVSNSLYHTDDILCGHVVGHVAARCQDEVIGVDLIE